MMRSLTSASRSLPPPENEDARCRDAKTALQIVVCDADDVRERGGVERVGHGAQRQMRGRERHAQRSAGQQHHGLRRARELGQELGVPGELHAGVADHALLHRRRDDRCGGAGHAQLGTAAQHLEHIGGVGGVEIAGAHRRAQRHGQHLQATRQVRPDGASARALP